MNDPMLFEVIYITGGFLAIVFLLVTSVLLLERRW